MSDDRPGDGTELRPPPPPAPPRAGERRRRRSAPVLAAAAGIAVLAIASVAAVALLGRGGTAPREGSSPGSGSAGTPGLAPGTPPVAAGSPAASAGLGATARPSGVPSPSEGAPAEAPTGRLAVLDEAGTLAVVDDRGGPVASLAVAGISFGPPAWSPDGTRIAAIGSGPASAAIYVFQVPPGGADGPIEPVVIYRSADRPPFYLYWSPDGERVAFLATEPSGISLRTASADGGAPTDGPEGDGVLREGAPLYLAWEDAGRMLVHIGVGPDGFAGEIDMGGVAAGRVLEGSGNYRAAGVSRDGRWVASVRGDAATAELVVETRDGSGRTVVPVLGPAALAFDPAGSTLAWIAADEAAVDPASFPFGPLRLLDPATGETRTLLDGSVAGFFWSPDGRTLATLRLAPAGGPTARSGPAVSLAAVTGPAAAATPEPELTLHLTFVDAATGAIRSDRTIRLGEAFIVTVLPYFDQYALSHRAWSPDSASIVLPLIDAAGRTRATIVLADGSDARVIADAVGASWAP